MFRLNKASLGKLLRVASDVIPKLPSRGDSPLTVLVKLLGVADSVTKESKAGSTAALQEFFAGLDAKTATNEHFVELFFATELQSLFQVDRVAMGENTDIVRAGNQAIGTLWFIEYRYSAKPEQAREFWFSTGFRFDRTLDRLWELYDGRLHLEVAEGEWGRRRSSYSRLAGCDDPLLGDAVARLERVVAKHRRYLADRVPVTYLFVGPHGTGKTTFALRMAEQLGKRTLRIDASGFATSGLKDLDFILDGLKPGFVIVDDVDRAPDLAASLPTLLTVLTNLKTRHPEVAVVLTANDASKFDEAMLRPGRVDEIEEFEAPTAEERRALLTGYLRAFGLDAGETVLMETVAATEGMGAAHLRHFALQLRYESPTGVLAQVELRKKLGAAAKGGALVPGGELKASAPT